MFLMCVSAYLTITLSVLKVVFSDQIDSEMIEIKQGNITGFYHQLGSNTKVLKYIGIPYAQPPIDDLRFRPPLPAFKWNETYEAKDYKPACMQNYSSLLQTTLYSHYRKDILGVEYSEDCLYLNIFIPVTTSKRPKPVMVFFHGPDLKTGSSSWKYQDPSVLAVMGNVIVVTLNYRLGIFGFLITEDIPGSPGLLDQKMALEWIQENIEHFGGDKKKVILFGQGSGADSVLWNIASPMSKGLFPRAVLQSMSRYQQNGITTDDALRQTQDIAVQLGCAETSSLEDAVTCLTQQPSSDLLQVASEYKFEPRLHIGGEFMPKAPKTLLLSSEPDVRVLISLNSHDGNMHIEQMLSPEVYATGLSAHQVETLVNTIIHDIKNVSDKSKDHLASLIYLEYFKDVSNSTINLQNAIDLVTHFYFTVPNMQFLTDFLSIGGKVYNVYFHQEISFIANQRIANFGTCFGEEIYFTFGLLDDLGTMGTNSTANEKKLTESIISAWSTFAFNGYPLYLSFGDVEERPLPLSKPGAHWFLRLEENMNSSNIERQHLPRKTSFWDGFIPKLVDREENASCIMKPDSSDNINGPIVTTYSGKIRGVRKKLNTTGEHWEGYFGIPYARPPTGSLRWRKPHPRPHWPGVLNATSFGPTCMQNPEVQGMSEDCLYLNVWVPHGVSKNTSYPTLVYIHGGMYMRGSGSIVGLENIALFGNLIVVTLNYRLGALGFLSTGDANCPGNFGLWDQLLALRWVKQNARSFGGDPDRITLSGHESGAASTSILMFSPLTTGLFHGVIAQSGSVFTSWALDKHSREKSEFLAHHLDCLDKFTGVVISCLKREDARGIVTVPLYELYTFTYYGPVIDWELIPGYPDESWIQNKPDILNIGFLGGAISTGGYLLATNQNTQDMESYMEYIKSYIHSVSIQSEASYAAVFMEYFLNSTNQREAQETAAMMFHDGHYAAGVEKIHQLISRNGGTSYSYDWEYVPSFLLNTKAVSDDDIYFTLGLTLMNNLPSQEKDFIKSVLTYWSNFIHSGNPNTLESVVPWPKYTPNGMEYLELSSNMSLEAVKHRKRYDQYYFWNYFFPNIDGTEVFQVFCTANDLSTAPITARQKATTSTTTLVSVGSTTVYSSVDCDSNTGVKKLNKTEAATLFLGIFCLFLLILLVVLCGKIHLLNKEIQTQMRTKSQSSVEAPSGQEQDDLAEYVIMANGHAVGPLADDLVLDHHEEEDAPQLDVVKEEGEDEDNHD